MKRISIIDAKPGMVLAQTVYSRDGKRLLTPGVALSEAYINRLSSLGIPILYIQEPDPLADLDLKAVYENVKELPDVISFDTRLKAEMTVQRIMSDVKSGRLFDLELAKDSVDAILREVLKNQNVIAKVADIRILDDYTFAHSVNVCVLSLATGAVLGYNPKQLYELGIGALLHDVGKVFVDPRILNKPGRLSDDEFEQVKKHPRQAYDLLRRHPGMKIVSANVAYQHHERFNGQGYPQGVTNKEIHDYARIVAIADVYDAMTANRVYKNMILPYEAIEFLIASAGIQFDPDLVKCFVENLAIYPIGSHVELNTGDKGEVIGINRSLPIRPVVLVTEDSEGKPVIPTKEVDLMRQTTIFIKRVISFRTCKE